MLLFLPAPSTPLSALLPSAPEEPALARIDLPLGAGGTRQTEAPGTVADGAEVGGVQEGEQRNSGPELVVAVEAGWGRGLLGLSPPPSPTLGAIYL